MPVPEPKIERVKLATLKSDPTNPNILTPEMMERLSNSFRKSKNDWTKQRNF
jgi:hypothetical protein